MTEQGDKATVTLKWVAASLGYLDPRSIVYHSKIGQRIHREFPEWEDVKRPGPLDNDIPEPS